MLELPALPLQHAAWVFAVLIAVVLFAPIAAERIRVPGVVGLILAGVLIGPHATGLLERDGAIALLGSVGLLYLMFMVGLELDLDDFARHRRDSVLFGVATFMVPMAIGVPAILAMGYGVLPAVLLASCWASHTLVAYPIFRRIGTTSTRSVATSVGATIITDTAALLVLAVVVRAHGGDLGATFWGGLTLSLAVLMVLLLWVLPRAARWFFGGLGQDRSVRFLFLLLALFLAAGLADLAGIEPIVGAFLAGLALNRMVPVGGLLMERVDFLGSTLFIPLFLVSVGMLVDPRLLLDLRTMAAAAGFTAIALGAKALAAWGTGALLRYDRAEIGTMFSLSGAQAAATLAAVIVGLDVGLIAQETVNAVIVVILVTCLVTSGVANRVAPRLPHPPTRRPLGRTVVVPVARPESVGPLVQLAVAIAARDSGTVIPLAVVPTDSTIEDLEAARRRMVTAEQRIHAAGGDARSVVRIDASPEGGVVHTVVEQTASLLVVGWKGEASRKEHFFGGIIDAVVTTCPTPVLVCRMRETPWRRVVLLVSADSATPAGRPSLDVALDIAARLAQPESLTVLAATDDPGVAEAVRLRLRSQASVVDQRIWDMAAASVGPEDLVIVPVRPSPEELHTSAPRVAAAAPDSSVLIALHAPGRTEGPAAPGITASTERR